MTKVSKEMEESGEEMNLQERNMELKKLKDIKKRSDKGIHLHDDYTALVNILIKLVKHIDTK